MAAMMAAIGLLVADTSWSNSRPRGNDPSFDNIGHKVGVVGVVGVWVGGVNTLKHVETLWIITANKSL